MPIMNIHPEILSGRQDSNLRSPAPKAGALATTLRPDRCPSLGPVAQFSPSTLARLKPRLSAGGPRA